MTEERVVVNHTTVDPAVTAPPAAPAARSVVSETVTRSPSGAEVARRVVVFVFGIIQLLIGLRIVLLLLAADRSNGLVAGILDLSAVLVAPFEGILRTDAIRASGSILDVSAVVALVGWTLLELVVIAAIRIARREP
jgi:hypothetical protein